eukprot:6760791-Prymnesium_polylepis.1
MCGVEEEVRGQVENAEGSRVQVLAALIVQAAWRAAANVKSEKRKRRKAGGGGGRSLQGQR